MSLTAGSRLGAFEIVSSLGAGGMGEVYRARDTRLGRDVALKILPDAFASDPDRLARFEREARTLASLNHPHIAQIHGVEESAGVHALVMEFVDGPTLADLIARGLATDDILAIGRQMADALEAAHEQGIIHRDLKPANIKVRADGTVKVLDFGLAKAAAPEGLGFSPATANSPTLTTPAMTHAGVILGTAAYMSPEQARGKPVDRRADIWAFGVILYEMFTRQRLFDGETVSDSLAAVLTRAIDVTRLPATVPPRVADLIARCLERDPKRRLRDIGEARIALDAPASSPSSVSTSPIVQPRVGAPAATTDRRIWRAAAPWVVAAAAVILALTALLRRDAPAAIDASLELELAPPLGGEFHIGSNAGFPIVSPDGTKVAFIARTDRGIHLWVRSLVRDDARALPGTDDAFYPFWSPDGARLAFFARGKLRTIDVAGGLPNVIADAPQGRGGSWGGDNVILFTPQGGGRVLRVAAGGGEATPVTTLDASRGENAHYWPVALPGGKTFLFFVRSAQLENNGIYLGQVDGSAAPVRVLTSLSSGIFIPGAAGTPGRLLWVRDHDLLSQAFDPSSGRLEGPVSAIASDVRVEESQRALLASASSTGTLVWASARAAELRLAIYDRSGRRETVLPIAPGKILQPAIAPDGRRFAFTRVNAGNGDIWLHDFASGNTTQLSTSPYYDEQAAWSPDGRRLVHQASKGTADGIRIVTIDGSEPPRVLRLDGAQTPQFSPDGRLLIVEITRSGAGSDVATIDPAADEQPPAPLVATPGNEYSGPPSPDGRWLTILTDRTGRAEIVVARLTADATGLRADEDWLPVSVDGGLAPQWRKDGGEIVYASLDGRVMAVSVTAVGNVLQFGKPTALFRLPADPGGWDSAFAANPDHTRFIVAEAPFGERQTVRLLTNWPSRLAAR